MSRPIPEPKRSPAFWLWIYQFLLILFGAGYLAARLARGRGIPGLRLRIGWYPAPLKQALSALKRPIWIHLVSVGEVIAAGPFIEELRRRFPDRDWVITTVTPTGQLLARRLVRGPQDQLLYLPWDLSPVVRRAIRAIRPSFFISFETELWPVLFDHLSAAGVPVAVVNGRISPAAYRRYLWIRPFMERSLLPVTLFLTQSPQDARRYAGIGAAKDRIAVTGNLKWDMAALEQGSGQNHFRDLLKVPDQAILWTAGSTHPGEESLILDVYKRLKARFPVLRLLIAPRHPERVSEVEREAARAGYRTVKRSLLGLKTQGSETDPVILLDTVGELNRVYQVSDLVFVGGSLVPSGGHNLVEPAAFRRPILTGPHLDNFQAMAESLTQAGGLVVVQSVQELEERLARLIADPATRRQMGDKAYAAIQQHRGATLRTVEMILRYWERKSSPG